MLEGDTLVCQDFNSSGETSRAISMFETRQQTGQQGTEEAISCMIMYVVASMSQTA